MTTPDEPAFLTAVLAELTDPLYASLDRANEIARAHFEGWEMTGAEYAACQSHLAGTNTARVAWFSNRHVTLAGIESSRLIGLWAVDEDDSVVVRVVRTIGEARWGQRNKIDIDIRLPRGSGAVRQLEFRPIDDLEVELPFENDDEESGEKDAGES